MKYFISNKIDFIQGFGNLVPSPASATHMRQKDAQSYVSMHSDHVIMKHGRAKKRNWIISTKQQFIGSNSEIVNSMKDARYFYSPEAAFKYMDTVNIVGIDELCIIDENFKRIKRPGQKLIKPVVQTDDVVKRERLSSTTKIKVANKSRYCFICGKVIEPDDFSVDHIVPVSKGGTNDLVNLVPVHRSCNQMKGDMLSDEFTKKITEIVGYDVYKNPTSEAAMSIIRCMVRGTLANKENIN